MHTDGRSHAERQQRHDLAPDQQRDARRYADAKEMTGEGGDRVHQRGHAAGDDQKESNVSDSKQRERQPPARTRPLDHWMRGTQYDPQTPDASHGVYRMETMSPT